MSNPGFAPTGFNLGGGSAGGSDRMSQYDDLINQAAGQYNLDAPLLRRQFVQESGGNANAVNTQSGATGIAQFMGPTARDMGVTDPTDPRQSIFGGAKYMRLLLDRYNQDYTPALAAYNWGMGNLERHGIENAPDETVDYVNRIRGQQILTRRQQNAMAMGGPVAAAAPANDAYPSYTDALGNVITRAQPMAQAPPFTPSGFNLAEPEAPAAAAPPPFAPSGFNLNTPEPATPYVIPQQLNAVPQLPVPLSPQMDLSLSQDQAPPVLSATDMPPMQAPPNLATAVPNDFADPNRKADPAVPWKPDAGWAENLASMPKLAVAGTAKFIGGGIRALGENQLGSGMAGPGMRMPGEQIQREANLSDQMAKSAGTPGSLAHIGKGISDHAEQVIIANTPNLPPGSAKAIANKVGVGILETIPALLATAATGGNAWPMIGHAFASSFGTGYADEMKQPGADPHHAALKAGGVATIDAAATALSLKAFQLTPFKGVSGTITNDMTGEVATYTRQSITNTIKNLTVQGVAIQPAIGLVNHGIDNLINGRPVTENMGEAYVTSAISNTLVAGLTHLASGKGGLTQVGKFEKPMGEAYEFNPEGVKFPGQEIGSYYAGDKQKPPTLGLPAPAQSQVQPVQQPATGEQTNGPVQTATNAPAAKGTTAPGEVIITPVGAGGQPDTSGKSGDTTGDSGTGGAPGVPLSAQAANTNGDVPAAAFTAPQVEPAAVAPTIVPSETRLDNEEAKGAAVRAFRDGNVAPVQLKNGETIYLTHVDTDADVGSRAITAFDKDGNRVGGLLYETGAMPDGTRTNPNVFVEGPWQRKGVATAMYDLAEQHGGLIPDFHQPGQLRSPEGQAFRRARAGIPPEQTRVAKQEGQDNGTIRTDYEDTAGNHVGYSIHDPETRNINTIRVNEDVRRQGHGERILRHLVNSGAADKATAGSYEALKLNQKVGGVNEGGGNKFTFTPENAPVEKAPGTTHVPLSLEQKANASGGWFDLGKDGNEADREILHDHLAAKLAKNGKIDPLQDIPPEMSKRISHTGWAGVREALAANPAEAIALLKPDAPAPAPETTETKAQEEPATAESVRAEITQLQNDGTISAEEAKQLGGMLKVMPPGELRATIRGTIAARQGGGYTPMRDSVTTKAPRQETTEQEAPPEDEAALDEEAEQSLGPEDKAILDLLDKQIARRTEAAETPAEDLQLKRQIEYRDAFLKAKGKTKIPRRRPKVDLSAPEREGKPKEFLDYKFQTGTPVFRDAFVEYGMAEGMSMDEALDYAERAIQFHAAEQVAILRHQVKAKFGFADVTINPKLRTKDARDLLLDFHRAAQDMMHALAMPVEMASINGKVTLALEPSSKGQYGSYSPADKTITVNGRASVFGHEWVHALDHDMSDSVFHIPNPQPLATYLSRAGQLNPADHMAVRMGHLMNTIFYDHADLALQMMDLHNKGQELTKQGQPKQSALKAQADLAALQTGARVKKMKIELSKYFNSSSTMGDAYWTKPWELMARAGEAYLAHTMTLQGLDPRTMVMPDEAYLSKNDERLRDSFPHDEDRTRIIEAFDHLMDGYRQEVLAGSVAAAQALRGGTSDPRLYSKLSKNTKRVGAFRTLANRIRNMNDTLQRTALTDPLRPDPGLYHAWHRAQVWASSTFNSRMGHLEALHDDPTTPDKAKPYLQALMDRLGRTHGTGRHTGWQPIEERQNLLLNKRMFALTNILLNNGFSTDSMTKEENDHIHHAMTTGEDSFPVDPLQPKGARVPITDAERIAAKELRGIHDEIFHDIEDAKMEIGYAESSHFPRLYDQVRAHKEPEGFLKHAAALHKEIFDDEIKEPGKYPENLANLWTRLPKERKDSAPQEVQDGLRALKKNLSMQRELKATEQANGFLTAAEQAALDHLEQEAEQLAIDNHDGLGNHVAKINADIWLLSMRTQRALDYDQTGPGGDFLNKRTLPPQTDRIMRDFMNTDIVTALARYYEATSRRIAQAERFGPKGEVLKELYDQMLNNGMEPDDVKQVQWVVNSMIGKTDNSNGLGITKAADYAHSTAAVGLMSRAAYITMPEAFTIAMSHRNLRAGLVSLRAAMGQVLRTASAKERTELAEYLGVIKSNAQNEIIMNRVGHDYSDSPRVGKFMSLLYQANLITGFTNMNSSAVMAGSHYLLKKWSKDLLSTRTGWDADDERDTAHRKLNEHGIHPKDQEAFANEILSLDGPPNREAVEKMQFAHGYSIAMYRLAKSGVLDPPKMSRPMLADEKWPGLALQFSNYIFEFQRTILDPAMRDIGYNYQRRYKKHRGAGHGKFRSTAGASWKATEVTGKYAMLGYGMVLLQYPTTVMTQYLFNHDVWEQREKDGTLDDWLYELAVSRVGFGGTIDIPFQALTSLRYDANLSTLTDGPSMRWINKNFYNLSQWGLGPSGKETGSNTRAHEGVKSLYNLIGIPLEAWLAVKLTGFGPIGLAGAAALLAVGTSQQTANRFADWAVGEKGTELPEHHGGLPHGPKLPHLQKPSKTKAEDKNNLAGAGKTPWGIVDDIMVAAWKLVGPVAGAIPSKAKWALALGALGYETRNFWNEYAPFRDAPPPKPKKKE